MTKPLFRPVKRVFTHGNGAPLPLDSRTADLLAGHDSATCVFHLAGHHISSVGSGSHTSRQNSNNRYTMPAASIVVLGSKPAITSRRKYLTLEYEKPNKTPNHRSAVAKKRTSLKTEPDPSNS